MRRGMVVFATLAIGASFTRLALEPELPAFAARPSVDASVVDAAAGDASAASGCSSTLQEGSVTTQGACRVGSQLQMWGENSYAWSVEIQPAGRAWHVTLHLPEKPVVGAHTPSGAFASYKLYGASLTSILPPQGAFKLTFTSVKSRREGMIRSLELHGTLDVRLEASNPDGGAPPPDALLHIAF